MNSEQTGTNAIAAGTEVELPKQWERTVLEQQLSSMSDKIISLLTQFRQHILAFNYEEAERTFSQLKGYVQLKESIQVAAESLKPGRGVVPTYLVGAKLLFEAHAKLCAIPTESILYALGHRFGDVFTIEQVVNLQLDRSEFGYASANSLFSGRVLAEFEETGAILSCYLHAHPGNGANANRPSSIDLTNQARLEAGRYPTIGGIFSRDGYLRFFSDKRPFRIVVTGKGVERVGENSFHLVIQ